MVDLKTFIADTLTGIAQGVQQANVHSGHHFMINQPRSNDTSYIDFDVAVMAAEEAGVKAGIFVVNIGAHADARFKNENVSRIKFKVNYRGAIQPTVLSQ